MTTKNPAAKPPTARKTVSEPKYTDPGCAYCPPNVRVCREGEDEERGPGFCPSKVNPDGMEAARRKYEDPFDYRVLESHGFEVASVVCKHDGIPKEDIGLKDHEKVRPGGHDSLFFKHSDGLVTTLVAKDRVLAHNPVGALALAGHVLLSHLGPGAAFEAAHVTPARAPIDNHRRVRPLGGGPCRGSCFRRHHALSLCQSLKRGAKVRHA